MHLYPCLVLTSRAGLGASPTLSSPPPAPHACTHSPPSFSGIAEVFPVQLKSCANTASRFPRPPLSTIRDPLTFLSGSPGATSPGAYLFQEPSSVCVCVFCFVLVDSPFLLSEPCLSISFPLQNDQLAKVSLFFIDTGCLAVLPKLPTRGSNSASRCDPDDFSAVQIVEAKVVMTFPLPGDLASSCCCCCCC